MDRKTLKTGPDSPPAQKKYQRILRFFAEKQGFFGGFDIYNISSIVDTRTLHAIGSAPWTVTINTDVAEYFQKW